MPFLFCWREFKPYIFPPFSLLGRILTKLKVDEVPDALVIAPWWPTAHWYPPLLQLLVQRPISSTPVGRAPNSASGGFSSPSRRCNAPSRVVCIRDNLQVRGISPRAASYVLKSWRPGTEKQYSAAWKCFCCWCDRKQRNPVQADTGKLENLQTHVNPISKV